MKSILITGANGGIGQACARMFLERWPDCRVFLGCRNARDKADLLAMDFSGRADVLHLDVTNPDDWTKAVAYILSVTQRLDVLVNNAGHHKDNLLATMPLDDWHGVISTNLTGTFLGCRAVVRPMLAQRHGRIINISSLSALMAPAGQANYAAAKAGVLALTRSLAKEVARANITVNALCPGYIDTAALGDSPEVQEIAKRVPSRRLGTAAEVAAAVLHFASDEAGYTTGATLKLDGGIL